MKLPSRSQVVSSPWWKRKRVTIIREDAKSHSLPPLSLVNHSDGGEPEMDHAWREPMRRVMAEVPGMNKSMLARAWNRDLRRVRELMNAPAKTQERSLVSSH